METIIKYLDDEKGHYQSKEIVLFIDDIDTYSTVALKVKAYGEDENETTDNMLLKINELISELEKAKKEISENIYNGK